MMYGTTGQQYRMHLVLRRSSSQANNDSHLIILGSHKMHIPFKGKFLSFCTSEPYSCIGAVWLIDCQVGTSIVSFIPVHTQEVGYSHRMTVIHRTTPTHSCHLHYDLFSRYDLSLKQEIYNHAHDSRSADRVAESYP